MPLLSIANLRVELGHRTVLHDVSLTVNEIVGLLGPNGAGKTTTMMATLGLSRPLAGGIRTLGRDPLTSGGAELRRQEQPVDLEDWSAHKAITIASLAPGQAVQTDWPTRLIAAGHYRVVVSAMPAAGGSLAPSRFLDFAVRAKPVVESGRVLPVALGMPALLLAGLLVRWRRGQGVAT